MERFYCNYLYKGSKTVGGVGNSAVATLKNDHTKFIGWTWDPCIPVARRIKAVAANMKTVSALPRHKQGIRVTEPEDTIEKVMDILEKFEPIVVLDTDTEQQARDKYNLFDGLRDKYYPRGQVLSAERLKEREDRIAEIKQIQAETTKKPASVTLAQAIADYKATMAVASAQLQVIEALTGVNH